MKMNSKAVTNQVNKPFVSAVIVSAGSSSRMGGVNKQFLDLGGMPVIAHSISAFQNNSSVDEIIVVTCESDTEKVSALVKEYGFSKVKSVVHGGSSRQESVLNGVNATYPNAEFVAIHDGARPLVSQNVINNTLKDAFEYSAAATGVKVKDTVKSVDEDSFITSTPDRSFMRFVQTPQIFEKKLYLDAVKSVDNSREFTDDCMLIEAYGKKVYLSDGKYENIKITTPDDINLALCFLNRRNDDA